MNPLRIAYPLLSLTDLNGIPLVYGRAPELAGTLIEHGGLTLATAATLTACGLPGLLAKYQTLQANSELADLLNRSILATLAGSAEFANGGARYVATIEELARNGGYGLTGDLYRAVCAADRDGEDELLVDTVSDRPGAVEIQALERGATSTIALEAPQAIALTRALAAHVGLAIGDAAPALPLEVRSAYSPQARTVKATTSYDGKLVWLDLQSNGTDGGDEFFRTVDLALGDAQALARAILNLPAPEPLPSLEPTGAPLATGYDGERYGCDTPLGDELGDTLSVWTDTLSGADHIILRTFREPNGEQDSSRSGPTVWLNADRAERLARSILATLGKTAPAIEAPAPAEPVAPTVRGEEIEVACYVDHRDVFTFRHACTASAAGPDLRVDYHDLRGDGDATAFLTPADARRVHTFLGRYLAAADTAD